MRQLQVLKIPVVEKKSFVVIEGDGAPILIVKNVYTVPLHPKHFCTIQQNQPKGGQRRGIRLHEILNRSRRPGDKGLCYKDLYGPSRANMREILARFGVTVRVRFFDYIDCRLTGNIGGVEGTGSLNGVDKAIFSNWLVVSARFVPV